MIWHARAQNRRIWMRIRILVNPTDMKTDMVPVISDGCGLSGIIHRIIQDYQIVLSDKLAHHKPRYPISPLLRLNIYILFVALVLVMILNTWSLYGIIWLDINLCSYC